MDRAQLREAAGKLGAAIGRDHLRTLRRRLTDGAVGFFWRCDIGQGIGLLAAEIDRSWPLSRA
jgi:hypothetical protein